jgi:ribosomal protein S12 methylthiotransferase accessory factor
MNKNMIPPDKDLSFLKTIENFERIFVENNFNIETVSWLNPVKDIWSVHVRDKDCSLLYTNGKGVSKNGALASAYGEFFERLSTGFFFADYYFDEVKLKNSEWKFFPNEKWFSFEDNKIPDGILSEELIKFYDPHGELHGSVLRDFNHNKWERGICTLPYKIMDSDKIIYFPVNILNNLYVSNGMAAGNSMPEARVQALSEIIERYVKNKIISQSITLPMIPDSEISKFSKVTEGIRILEKSGFKVLVKDASLGGKFPVVNITIINREDSGVFAAFGAHPLFQIAIERTLTELLQGRTLDKFENLKKPIFDQQLVAGYGNLEEHFIDSNGLLNWKYFNRKPDYTYKKWVFQGDRIKEEEFLKELITNMGFKIYFGEYKWMGVNACRIIIPGMSEIYPVCDLVESNKNEICSIRDFLITFNEKTHEECKEFYEEFCELGYSSDENIGDIIGIPSDSPFLIVEVNILLALYLEEYDDLIIWCESCSNLKTLNNKTKTLYNCLEFITKSKLNEKEDKENTIEVANLFFESEIVNRCFELFNKNNAKKDLFEKVENLLNNKKFSFFTKTVEKCRKIQNMKKNVL